MEIHIKCGFLLYQERCYKLHVRSVVYEFFQELSENTISLSLKYPPTAAILIAICGQKFFYVGALGSKKEVVKPQWSHRGELIEKAQQRRKTVSTQAKAQTLPTLIFLSGLFPCCTLRSHAHCPWSWIQARKQPCPLADLSTALFGIGPANSTISQGTQEESCPSEPSVIGLLTLFRAIDPEVAVTWLQHQL